MWWGRFQKLRNLHLEANRKPAVLRLGSPSPTHSLLLGRSEAKRVQGQGGEPAGLRPVLLQMTPPVGATQGPPGGAGNTEK